MKLKLFSIYDVKSGVYLAPFPARGDVDAVRNVKDGLRNPQMRETPIGQNPKDFELHELAMFDDESGEITKSPRPVLVVRIGDLAAFAAEEARGTGSS